MEEQTKRSIGIVQTAPAPADDNDEITIDLLELCYRLIAHWKMILCACLCFVVLFGLCTVFLITPKYQATSVIYVLSRRDTAINMADLQIGSALTGDYAKVFELWEVHEQVISNLELPYSYQYMMENLSVENDTGTRMLDISFTSPDPAEAAEVANEYARVASQYIADTMATDKPSIMSVALTPANPISPSLVRNLLIGLAIGLVLSCGYVTVRMLLDDKFKTSDDITKYTGLTTLAVIPIDSSVRKENGKKEKSTRRRKQ